MKHQIEVANPGAVAGDREWMQAFAKIREAFIAQLEEHLAAHPAQDCKECTPQGKLRESYFDDAREFLRRRIDDGTHVAYGICEHEGERILWICADDELRRMPKWPCAKDKILVQDAHFGVVAVKRKKRALPVDEKHVAQAEQELGVRFPASYRTRICQANGGELKVGRQQFLLFPIFDKTDRKSIRRTTEHLVVQNARLRDLPKFPSDAVAIGADDIDSHRLVLFKTADQVELGAAVFRWTEGPGTLKKLVDDIQELE